MWQQAVVICAFLLFKSNDYLIRSDDYSYEVHLEDMENTTMGRKDDEFTTISENGAISSKQIDDELFINISSNNENDTIMALSKKKYFSSSPMQIMLILMGIMTVLIASVIFVLFIYTTEKRLFMERQIAMKMVRNE
ncbi:Flagellar assembly factor FliW [Dirofilaria immitis]